mmetsp:Transcript_32681/g.104701  ORF Transcript_32681/g.104701 Transcript_32681/m.104701 type:complete len:307 (+) Transcript_32681:32-952(+)
MGDELRVRGREGEEVRFSRAAARRAGTLSDWLEDSGGDGAFSALPVSTAALRLIATILEEEEEAEDTNVPANELKERAVGSFAEQGEEDEDEDQEWSVDTSADAVAARLKVQEAAYSKVEAAEQGISDKKAMKEEGLDEFEIEKRKIGDEVRAALEKSEAEEDAKARVAVGVKALMEVAEKRDLQPLDLFGFLFDGVLDATAVTTLKAHTRLLQKLYKATPDKKKTQSFLLKQIEALVGRVPELEKKVPTLLKLLYDADILDDEDVLFKWHEKESKKKLGRKVREAAAPFITWLKEADDESEEESD